MISDINDSDIIAKFFCRSGKINSNLLRSLDKDNVYIKYLLNRFVDSDSLLETIYRIKNNIHIRPVCPVCGGHLSYIGSGKYRSHCSVKCSSLDKNVQYKLKQTKLEKYGDENYVNIEKFKNTCLIKYNATSPLLNPVIIEKTQITNLVKYGKISYHNNKKSKETKLKRYGNENYNGNYSNYKRTKNTKEITEKRKDTCLIKYGEDNYSKTEEFKKKYKKTMIERYNVEYTFQSRSLYEKFKQSCLKKYGYEFPIQNDEIKNKVITTCLKKYGKYGWNTEKQKETMLKKYGVDNFTKSDEYHKIIKEKETETVNKRNETKRKNGTFNKSKEEDISYELIKEKYSDVIRQYKSKKYPFSCDFYIPSIDTYIECNYFWTHGFKAYTGTNEDITKLNEWKDNNTEFYDNAIKTWTVRDVEKRKVAKDNNLNYLEFFNINELKIWLNNI